MKNLVKLLSSVIIILVLTGSAYAYFSGTKKHVGTEAEASKAVYATAGNNVYWLTASIDEYENQSGNITKVNYAK